MFVGWGSFGCGFQLHKSAVLSIGHVWLTRHVQRKSYFDQKVAFFSRLISRTAVERIRDLDFTYTEGWGITETTSLGIGNPLFGRKKYGSIGLPFPDMDIRLVEIVNGGEDAPLGQPGELIVRGPLVMSGYWNNPQETAEHIRDGWLHTGDIATQGEDGYLYVVDRKKDMIIAGATMSFLAKSMKFSSNTPKSTRQ